MLNIDGQLVPHELQEIADPTYSALLIIDMQNGYCARLANTLGEQNTALIRRIARFAESARSYDVPIIHIRMLTVSSYTRDSPYWLRMRWRAQGGETGQMQSLADGSWEADFVSQLTPREPETIITKYRSSAFFDTPLNAVFRKLGTRTLLCTGCTTEGCIESTVRDASLEDYFPIVVTDCVASDKQELHQASLQVMGAYRADLATSEQISAAWQMCRS